MNVRTIISSVTEWSISLPVLLFVVGISILCTLFLKAVQIRYFFKSWANVFCPSQTSNDSMTPLQAFINTLSTNLGNGSVAGMATAIHAGGPGAAFWVVFFGLCMMSVRFAEVFLSSWYGARKRTGAILGGPMLYLRDLPFGKILSYSYAISCVLFGLSTGNSMQTNSICLSLKTTWPMLSSLWIGICCFVFMLYALLGGSKRIIQLSNAIVPLKVGLFFISAFGVLGYFYASIPSALGLIFYSAFNPIALTGGIIGITVKQAVQMGMSRSVMATESGLGTAAILFGFTESKDPMESGLMGMLSTFVSTCVCFLIALCIVTTGVWSSGATSTELTIAAYQTTFGVYAGPIVTILSLIFGIGVAVSYAYIVRAAWLYVTNGKGVHIFTACYALCSFLGAIMDVAIVWDIATIINSFMLIINLCAITYFLPLIAREMKGYA